MPAGGDGGQAETDPLGAYRGKRNFERTAEPSGAPVEPSSSPAEPASGGDAPRFVVQKHAARRLHYDVRFEADGVLISWAVPKGPSYDPAVKRLAVHVEDHPLDYATFEGTIPSREYGAGTVIVWDEGTYRNMTEKNGKPVGVAVAVAAGHLSVWLEGTKLRGGWSLTRTSPAGAKEAWIMVKRNDEHADRTRDIITEAPNSATTGRDLEQVNSDQSSREWNAGQATWRPPMLAQPLRMPLDGRILDQPGWLYERKLDGLRCLAVRNGAQVELWSRNHLPFTARFPEVVTTIAALPADNFTIDGELVAFDGERTSFALLQRRDPTTRVEYHAFDLLRLLGRDTTGLPLSDRLRLLAQALAGAGDNLRAVVTIDTGSQTEPDPRALLDAACQAGWEGLIAKRADSTYKSGRSPDWRKLKCTASQELVVGGWTEPSGSRVGLGALLVGFYDEDGLLQYAGRVGTGFDDKELADLRATLAALAATDAPFDDPAARQVKGVHWVRPEMVVAVAFSEWTPDGRLRHPRFEGVRTDKEASDVRREIS
jgi:bifunctional non-homologous end joining protein LigD